jgi:hypothetical protein
MAGLASFTMSAPLDGAVRRLCNPSFRVMVSLFVSCVCRPGHLNGPNMVLDESVYVVR